MSTHGSVCGPVVNPGICERLAGFDIDKVDVVRDRDSGLVLSHVLTVELSKDVVGSLRDL